LFQKVLEKSLTYFPVLLRKKKKKKRYVLAGKNNLGNGTIIKHQVRKKFQLFINKYCGISNAVFQHYVRSQQNLFLEGAN